ncbi:MAG: nucleoside triphosphate pyrophosphohydrolase [bacterium]
MGKHFDELVEIMKKLRGKEGCPWDKEQTIESIKPYLIEECYEVIEAIESGCTEKIKDELGDLFFQILFLAQIGDENGMFDINDILQNLKEKMIRRHPHVFSTTVARDKKEVLVQWEAIKKKEKPITPKESILDGIPKSLPSLILAYRIQERAARVGFDFETTEAVIKKSEEEFEEFKSALEENNVVKYEEELGDLIFSMVNLSRFLNIDAERAIKKAIERFSTRFHYIENKAVNEGIQLINIDMSEKNKWWEEAKNV